jgi:hypothetical protein
MELYRIRVSPEKRFTVIYKGKPIIAAASSTSVDHTVHIRKYGVRIPDEEVRLFKTHRKIWQHFLRFGEDTCALIIEEGVTLKVTEKQLTDEMADLGRDWDIFFPYDKLRKSSQMDVLPLPLSRLGFFWGYHIYLLSKDGARKMSQLRTVLQPVDETMLTMSLQKRLSIVAAPTLWYECQERRLTAFEARKREAISAVNRYNVWSIGEREACITIINYLAQQADLLELKIFLHAGTLLGAIRHGGIMDWDDDVDLMMEEKAAEKLVTLVDQQGDYRVTEWIWPKTGKKYYKIWHPSGQKAEGYEYTFPFVDIWVLYDDVSNRCIRTNDGHEFDRDFYFPLKRYEFEGVPLYIQNRPLDILDGKYKGWRDSINIYSWSHRTKRHDFGRIIVPIKTDNNGRFLAFD